MTVRSALHQARDAIVRLAAERPFRPVESPEKRVVLVRPDHFGDMLMVAPAINAIRSHVTDHEIVLMTGPWNREVAEHIAQVDRIVTFPFPGFERSKDRGSRLEPYRRIGEAAAILRELRPEAAVLLRDDHWWGAWIAREAGVPLRIGYRERGLDRFYSHPVNVSDSHYIQQNYHLISTAIRILGYTGVQGGHQTLGMTWPRSPGHSEEAKSLLDQAGVSGDYLVVHPGTGAPVKRWPAERWAATIDLISPEIGMPVVLTGGPDERSLCEQIARETATPVIDLAGETSLFTLAELLRGARLVMGVDSGPLHLSTAVRTPSIHLYGPSDAGRYGPWGDPRRHRVLTAGMHCPACGDLSSIRPEGCGCMMAITPEVVAREALEMLNVDR